MIGAHYALYFLLGGAAPPVQRRAIVGQHGVAREPCSCEDLRKSGCVSFILQLLLDAMHGMSQQRSASFDDACMLAWSSLSHCNSMCAEEVVCFCSEPSTLAIDHKNLERPEYLFPPRRYRST